MADVFLSYSRKDYEQALQVADRLKEAGCSIFWDRDLEAGAQWPEVIEEQLRNAGAVVVLWSENSTESEWVQEEALIARDLGILIPARIDEVEPPFGFKRTEAYDLFDAEQGNGRMEALADEVAKQARAANKASAFLRKAFRLRKEGNFEGATREVKYAFTEFYDLLNDKDRRTYDDAVRYKEETIEELKVVARDTFGGKVKETLSGLALLPIVDAVLELQTRDVQELMAKCCKLDEYLAKKEKVRVGAVIRPGSAIDNELLIRQLLRETGERGGALDLHCFLVVMNTKHHAPAVSFTEMAKLNELPAACINWRPVDGRKAIDERLKCTVHRLCADTVSHELPCP